MDTAASGLGIATAPAALFQMGRAVCVQIRKLHDNPIRHGRLKELADNVLMKLQSAEMSRLNLVFTMEELEAVNGTLESVNRRNIAVRFVNAWDDSAALAEAERRLRTIRNHLESIQLRPTVCNENIELPVSEVGLDRGTAMVDFLERTNSEDFRVIAIHGQPGVGKTTLLNHVWDKVTKKDSFRAYIQLGHDASRQTIRDSQTSILRQLCGFNKEFPSSDFGKGELKASFKVLKDKQKPVFLALDNVFRVDDLKQLLPDNLARDNLPASSCIVMTCRDYKIVEALLGICGRPEHVYCFEPQCLTPVDSRRLFAECAGMIHSAPEHQMLLDALVPLCGGLPLALVVLGKTFLDVSRRERKAWQRVQKSWVTRGGDDHVRSALDLSFKMLKESHQIAFLDMVSTFYGWDAGRVQRIVGEDVMEDLINSSLVSTVDHQWMCNPNALRIGCDIRMRDSGYYVDRMKFISMYDPIAIPPKFISMHDLILKFGENLILESTLGFHQIVNSPLRSSLKAHMIRSVHLSSLHIDECLLDFLRSATNLQMLILNSGINGKEPLIDRSSSCQKNSHKQLQCLILDNCISSRPIMEMKVSSEIKEIVIEECNDVEELPSTPLHNLERLEIRHCSNFQGFSASCVKEWNSLQDLTLDLVPKITRFPTELGRLQSLEVIRVTMCDGLKEFPSLSSRHGPSSLMLIGCDALTSLGPISCPLQSLHLESLGIKVFEVADVTALRRLLVRDCPTLRKLPAIIVNASSLESLTVADCESLVELLPDEDIGNMESLTELTVCNCQSLERLPAGIFEKASSLQKLEVVDTPLVTLPTQITALTSLIELNLYRCREFVELPEAIVDLCSLKVLRLEACHQLKRLPFHMGWLRALKELSLQDCIGLRLFSDSIFNIQSLEALNLSGVTHGVAVRLLERLEAWSSLKSLTLLNCSQLENLPASVCSVTSLEELQLGHCESLTELPDQIGGLRFLKKLGLGGCTKLKELPEQIGGLNCLRKLTLSSCKKLEKLPHSLCSITSLEELQMGYCESLTELPDQIGGLCFLKELGLGGCTKLKMLPGSIGTMSSLEDLDVSYCEGLVELPEQIGGLDSLRKLKLSSCKKLEKLPDSLCSITSLEQLQMGGCESLTELPDQIGRLCFLKELGLRGCTKLKGLPGSIGTMTSLLQLCLIDCESLRELPQQIGGLTSLKIIWADDEPMVVRV